MTHGQGYSTGISSSAPWFTQDSNGILSLWQNDQRQEGSAIFSPDSEVEIGATGLLVWFSPGHPQALFLHLLSGSDLTGLATLRSQETEGQGTRHK